MVSIEKGVTRSSGRRRAALGNVSALALLAGASIAVPAAAQDQAKPGDPQCPVTLTEVNCTGALPKGFDVPTADRDRYTRLTIRNVTGAIDARSNDGVAIDVYNESQAVSILIDAPDLDIGTLGANYPRPGYVVSANSAIGIRARTRGDISIISNADITVDADEASPSLVQLAAGIAAEMVHVDETPRNLVIKNAGDITITSDEEGTVFDGAYGIWAGYSYIDADTSAATVDEHAGIRIGTATIENSGTITIARGAGIGTEGLDSGVLDILNSGTINAGSSGDQIFIYGIEVSNGNTSIYRKVDRQKVTIRNTGTISLEDRGVTPIGIDLEKSLHSLYVNYSDPSPQPGTVINDGSIIQTNIETGDFGHGIDIHEPGARANENPNDVAYIKDAALTAINNGTISVANYGIEVSSNANRIIRNTGTIDIAAPGNFGIGVELNFSSDDYTTVGDFNPLSYTTLFENSATGIIRVGTNRPQTHEENSPAGVIIYGGNPRIINAGLIRAEGADAVGIEHVAAYRALNDYEGIPAIAGRIDANNSGTIEAIGTDAIAFRVLRLYNQAADARDTVLVNSGNIVGTGDGAIGISHTAAPRPERPYSPPLEEFPEVPYIPPADPALAALGNATYTLTTTSVVRGGSGTGAAIRFEGGAAHSVTNAGLISAESGNAIIGGIAAETVDNSGRIEGSVVLGAGADRIIARAGGVITGAIDGGDGDDVLAMDVASDSITFTDRIGGTATGFERFEKTGAGLLRLTAPVAAHAALVGGTLSVTGNAASMAVDAAAGTSLQAAGSLGAVTLADGASLAPGGSDVGALTLASLTLSGSSILRFDLGAADVVGGPQNDLISVTGHVILDGLLDVNARPDFGSGVYRLIDYGGTLTDNGLTMGQAPTATYTVQTAVAGQVNLLVAGLDDLSVQFWDDGDTVADGQIDGGAGTWRTDRTNWTNVGGDANHGWAGNFAVFQGTGGGVTVEGAQSLSGMQFSGNGYRLSAGDGGSLILTAPEILVRVDPGVSAELALPLSGSGALVKRDTGTLILSGTNSYAGGTIIREGVLQAASDGALGAATGGIILDGGTLRVGAPLTSARAFTIGTGGGTFDSGAGDMTLTGVLTGNGALTRIGSGLFTFAGNGAGYAGTLRLASGTMALTGTLGGTIEVAEGARLGGTGTLGNLVVASGGAIAPGASIGTLTATGNILFRAGSFYDVELAAAGGTDMLRANGTATLEGGTVRIATLDPQTSYVDGHRYTFLSAANGLTGAFAGLTESSAFLDFQLGYDATSAFVDVEVVRTFPDVAQTFNQTQASGALAGFEQTAGSDSLAVYNDILLLDEGPARAAFDLTSGEIYAATLAASLRQAEGDVRHLLGQAHMGADEGWGLWGTMAGQDGRVASDGNGARYTQSQIGGTIGVDYRGTDNRWAIGFGGGYWTGDTRLAARASDADTKGWQIGGYARAGDGGTGFSATLAGGYAGGRAKVSRSIALGAITRNASARVDLDSWALAGELRYGVDVGGGWAMGPVAQLIHAKGSLGRFAEDGASSLNLSSGAGNDDGRTLYGGGLFARWSGERGAIDFTTLYSGGGRPVGVDLSMAGASSAHRVRAADPESSVAELGVAARYRISSDVVVGAAVNLSTGSGQRQLSGQASVKWSF